MAEWLYEDGIGERRAVLVDGDAILAIGIERDSDGVRAGAILPARRLPSDGSGMTLVRLDSGEEAICPALPRTLAEGASLLVRIVRSAIPEADLVKRAKAHPTDDDALPTDGPDLLARITASGHAVRTVRPNEPDAFEAAGWSEALAAAVSGRIGFDGGLLRISLTPAMTVIDVDGTLRGPALAHAGAVAAAAAIQRYDMASPKRSMRPCRHRSSAPQSTALACSRSSARVFARVSANGCTSPGMRVRR